LRKPNRLHLKNLRWRAQLALTLGVGAFVIFASCSIAVTRPVQEMSDTSAAIKAAKDVQADTTVPELYRQATEWWRRARHEYRFKNFDLALDYAEKARKFAEEAEFEAIKSGGTRAEPTPEPQPAPMAPSTYATPTSTPAADFQKGASGGGIPTPGP
jgi:hypothetical protein